MGFYKDFKCYMLCVLVQLDCSLFHCQHICFHNQRPSGDPPVGLIVLERCQVEKIPNDVRPFCFLLRKFNTKLSLSKQHPMYSCCVVYKSCYVCTGVFP